MSQTEGTSETFGEAVPRVFTVYRMPPKVARKHINRLAKILSPLFGGLVEAGQAEIAKGGNAEEADVQVGKLIAEAVESVDLDYLEKLMDVCAEYTVCEPGGELSKSYDAVFLGEPLTQYKWFWFALKVQFGDFFGALASDSNPIHRVITGGGQGQESRSTSTG